MGDFRADRLKDLIETSGLSYRQNSLSYIFTCPLCQKREKLYIRKHDGRFVCFVCAEGERRFRGLCEFALTELLGLPIREIKRRLYGDDFDGKTPDDLLNFQLYDFYGEDDEITEDVTPTLPTLSWPSDFYPIDDPKSVRGLKYLERERGVPLALAQQYGIRYCPPQRRVIFPVEVAPQRLVGWQARSVIGATPKAITSKGFQREKALMFSDKLKGSDHAVLCEGPIDAIKAHLCGGAIATMGKAVSKTQIAIIRACGVRSVYLAIDPDAAAEMERLCHSFGDLMVYSLQPPNGRKDLGECTPEEVLEQFQKAPLVDSGTLFLYFKR